MEFSGEVRVASRIIDYLSSGLYQSPAACLKELVNNGYDADATEVRIFVKPDADRIIIEDDGTGLSRGEFEHHFRRVAESHKRDDVDTTASGRPKIGKIGIGLIAANEICEILEIHSTKKGSNEVLRVTLNFDLMRLEPEARRREGQDFAKGDYVGTVSDDADVDEHYTKLYLLKVRGPAREILAGATDEAGDPAASLYGLQTASVEKRLAACSDWDEFDRYSQTMLHVGLNVPVRYHDHWVPTALRPKVRKFEREPAQLAFKVAYDGSELRKPVVFSPPVGAAIFDFDYEGADIAASGYFYAQRQVLKPRQLQGVLIRIRHSAVGEYDDTFLDFPGTRFPLFQNWVSAEVLADDRLEDAMNIDRRTFRDTHPAYVELKEAFHGRLVEVLSEVRTMFYERPRKQRSADRVAHQQERVREVIERATPTLGRKVARKLQKEWSSPGDGRQQRMVLRKYSVSEIYEVMLEVAESTLSQDDFTRFVEELDRRLRS